MLADLLEQLGLGGSKKKKPDEGERGADVQPGPPGTSSEPDEPAPFYECAHERGVDLVHDRHHDPYSTPGQAWGDIDRDDHLDLVLTTQRAANRVFMGGPGGQFSSPSWAADVALADRLSSGAVLVDYDNDGWLDLYVLARGPNTLLRNLAGQGFADVTDLAGVGDPGDGETAA
ncbi:MAG: VCBS repeat-containing protein, partial [Myxococcales bacterium]|nr:VCBS repeat-containing protein [Myxococcales bacterium]